MATETILPTILEEITDTDLDIIFSGEPIFTLTNEVYGQLLLSHMLY